MLSDGTLAGITTMFVTDAGVTNFAIPASELSKFLAYADIRTRDVAAGASINWSLSSAFDIVRSETDSRQYTDAEKNALNQLKAVEGTLLIPSARALELAKNTDDRLPDEFTSLPDEFNYLAHFIIGQADRCAAVEAVHASSPDRQLTNREFASRYRSNRFAIAAISHLSETTKLQPGFASAYFELVNHYTLSGDKANALIAANTLVNCAPRCADALNMRARCYSELEEPESARQDLEAAIELSPRHCVFYGRLADVLVELGDNTGAITQYEKAIEFEKYDIFKDDYYFDMGVAYYKDRKFEKAAWAFAKAKNLGYPAESCDPMIAYCIQSSR